MEPITAGIIVILGKYALDKLGKYALDKGVELGQEIGPKALDTAKEMFTAVLDRLRKDPKGEVLADGFEEDPAIYEKPVEVELEKEMQADPEFAAQLQALLARYEGAAREHAAASGRVYQATVTGSGAVAQDGSVAAGAGGIAIGGDVRGGVRTGGSQEEDE